MPQIKFRKKALTRLAVFCLGTSALTIPALAASFSVGGGTINTTQTDSASNSTGTGGPFALQANTVTTGDIIAVSSVSITNSSSTPNGRALDVGGLQPSSGTYSVTMHGSTLAGDSSFGGAAGAWFQSVGGLVSFDSTGGAANTISGKQGLAVINNTSNGSVSIKTGADSITSSSGEALYGVAQGTGTISIDIAGATLNSSSLYGIAASGGNGLITIGGLNGGLSGTINAVSGSGIFTTSTGNQSITLASGGTINALNGMTLGGASIITVDSFGTINASNNAISGASLVTLESSSTTIGKVLGSSSNETFNIVAGANISGATFDGSSGNDTLNLAGSGNGSFAVSSASNIEAFQKSGTGTWTLTGTTTNVTPWAISAGVLAISNVAALGASSGGVVLNGGTLDFSASGTLANGITFATGSTSTLSVANGQSITLSGALVAGQGAHLVLGTPAENGTINFNLSGVTSGGPASFEIAGGTVADSNGLLGNLLGPGGAITTVDAGATLDIPNGLFVITSLNGSGQVNTLSVTTLTIGNASFSGVISGSGQLVFTNAALFGASTYTGGTTISGGTVQIGNVGALGSGVISIPNGTLVSTVSGTLANSMKLGISQCCFSGSIPMFVAHVEVATGQTLTLSGSSIHISGDGAVFGSSGNAGTVIFSPTSGSIDPFAEFEIAGGTVRAGNLQLAAVTAAANVTQVDAGAALDLASFPTTINALFGDGQVKINGAALRLGYGYYSGIIAGTGTLEQLSGSTRPTLLLGANTYTGGTIIDAGGILQLGNGGTSGSIVGNIQNNGVFAIDRSDAYAIGGIVSGTGTVNKMAAGTLTLSGANTYTGATTVSAGALSVTGSIANSNVSVASGATLGGTGTVGSTTIASGGTLAPGNSIGTLTVNGNLTLAAGSSYNVEVSPAAADRTMVSGTASLNGTVATSIAPGAYAFGQRFTLLTATAGVSGTFASLTGIPVYLKGGLSYDANNTYLTISPNTLAPLLSNASANQGKVVAAIDASVAAGNVPGGGFVALYSFSGPALNSALDQISGQVGPNTINAVGQGTLSFLTMTAQGGSNSGDFAPGSAYGGADAPHRAQLGAGETRVWGAAYGGHVGLSADAASGAASLSSSNVGLIGGADMAWDDGWLAGVTAGLGQQNFSSGNGTGSSDDIMIGVYARKDAGPLYVTAAFCYGAHHIETLRVITVSGTDVLQGKQNADDFGGRIEAGWRMALDDKFTLTPYFAVAAESFETPAYAENALSGASTFALSFAAHSSALGRTELGSIVSRNYETENGVLTVDLRGAWAHQLDDLPLTQASFQSLPGASFLVTGVRPASDTALLGAGVQIQNRSGLFFGFRGETQLGIGTTIVEGMGNLGWRW